MASHVVHLAVKTRFEPAQEVLLILRDVDARHAQLAETQGPGPCHQLEFGRVQVN